MMVVLHIFLRALSPWSVTLTRAVWTQVRERETTCNLSVHTTMGEKSVSEHT